MSAKTSENPCLGSVVRVNVNPAGGVPKRAVASARVHREGVEGDKQKHRRFHGGPTRAVCLFSLERIEALRAEGHTIEPGSTGENLTVSGLDWPSVRVGDRLRVGDEVVLQITSHAVPCKQIAGSFDEGEFGRMSEKKHPGWSRLYARVLEAGIVRPGDRVEHLLAND